MIGAASGALARVADILGIPMFFSVVPENGRPPTHLPTLAGHAVPANTFVRRSASPFMDGGLVEAMAETGRGILVVAGFATEAVTLKAGLDGLVAGYDVRVALDAGGGRSERTENAALRRLERAGAITTSVADIIISCAPDFSRPPGSETFAVLHELMASDADNNGEPR